MMLSLTNTVGVFILYTLQFIRIAPNHHFPTRFFFQSKIYVNKLFFTWNIFTHIPSSIFQAFYTQRQAPWSPNKMHSAQD